MSKNKEYNAILKAVQKVIEAKSKPCTIEQVIRDYYAENSKRMPYEALGYNSERDLLQNAKIFEVNKINGKVYIQMANEKNTNTLSETKLRKNFGGLRLWRDGSDNALSVGDSIHKQELELLAKFNKMQMAEVPNIPALNLKQQPKGNNTLRKAKSAFTKDVQSVSKIHSAPIKMEVGRLSKTKTVNKSRSSTEKMVNNQLVAITKNRKSSSTILPNRIAGGQQTVPKKKTNLRTQARRNYGNGDGKILDFYDDDNDDKVSNTDLGGNSSLTSIKLVDRLKNTSKPELNFLEWHLINILHTKVAAHPNGFLSDRLPEWYGKTFDKPIPSDWWHLVVKSEKFDISTVENKVKLKARYDSDLSIQNVTNISKQGKIIDKNIDQISNISSSSSSRSSRSSLSNDIKYDFH